MPTKDQIKDALAAAGVAVEGDPLKDDLEAQASAAGVTVADDGTWTRVQHDAGDPIDGGTLGADADSAEVPETAGHAGDSQTAVDAVDVEPEEVSYDGRPIAKLASEANKAAAPDDAEFDAVDPEAGIVLATEENEVEGPLGIIYHEAHDPVSDRTISDFPGVVREPMGDGSVGGAFVESGAIVNTGGPHGPSAARLDDRLLEGERDRTFPGPSYGDASIESGAAVNTGGVSTDVLHGDGTVDDGVDRARREDLSGKVNGQNPTGSHDPSSPAWDGVERADLSSLVEDAKREAKKHNDLTPAKGIGTTDWSPVSEAQLGVGGALVNGDAGKEVPPTEPSGEA